MGGTPGVGTPTVRSCASTGARSSTCSMGSEESRSSWRQGFGRAFHHMGFRSLLAMLTSKVPAEEVDLHDHIDRVLTTIRIGKEPPTTAEPSESSWWPAAKSSA